MNCVPVSPGQMGCVCARACARACARVCASACVCVECMKAYPIFGIASVLFCIIRADDVV